MNSTQWAKLVYARTHRVDYRWLQIPDDFNHKDLSWATEHVQATTKDTRLLEDRFCWSIFRNTKHLAVGVTCYGDQIYKQDLNKTLDIAPRRIYGFFGYVTKVTPNQPIDIPHRNITEFAPLYSSVVQFWDDEIYNLHEKVPMPYTLVPSLEVLGVPDTANLTLNTDREMIFLYPLNGEEARERLWKAAAEVIRRSDTLFSLSLDIPEPSNPKSPFLNVGFPGDQTVEQVERRPRVKPETVPTPVHESEHSKRHKSKERESETYSKTQPQGEVLTALWEAIFNLIRNIGNITFVSKLLKDLFDGDHHQDVDIRIENKQSPDKQSPQSRRIIFTVDTTNLEKPSSSSVDSQPGTSETHIHDENEQDEPSASNYGFKPKKKVNTSDETSVSNSDDEGEK